MQTGGQMFEMPTGRLDGMISSAESANNNLVSTKSSASELTQKFLAQGLGQDEMITLSGMDRLAHFHIHNCNYLEIELRRNSLAGDQSCKALFEPCLNQIVLYGSGLQKKLKID